MNVSNIFSNIFLQPHGIVLRLSPIPADLNVSKKFKPHATSPQPCGKTLSSASWWSRHRYAWITARGAVFRACNHSSDGNFGGKRIERRDPAPKTNPVHRESQSL